MAGMKTQGSTFTRAMRALSLRPYLQRALCEEIASLTTTRMNKNPKALRPSDLKNSYCSTPFSLNKPASATMDHSHKHHIQGQPSMATRHCQPVCGFSFIHTFCISFLKCLQSLTISYLLDGAQMAMVLYLRRLVSRVGISWVWWR